MADLCGVEKDFANALQEMKEAMIRNGWILPSLKTNMRNQVNIANIQIDKGDKTTLEMQSSIAKLESGTSLVGEIPILFKVDDNDWDKKKHEVLKHCIELMSQKNDKNIVVLYDEDSKFKGLADDIKGVIKDKIVVSYPFKQSKKHGISNVKQFVEKRNHILVTVNKYFNGCESPNVIVVTRGVIGGIRNSLLRGVQNILCIQLTTGGGRVPFKRFVGYAAKINGMKDDRRFLSGRLKYKFLIDLLVKVNKSINWKYVAISFSFIFIYLILSFIITDIITDFCEKESQNDL